MSLASLLNTPVTITHRLPGSTFDAYRNEIPNEETLETVCELQQVSRSEPGDAGETSVADYRAIFPAGTVLATGDSIAVDGHDYEVVGDPWPARNPRLRLPSHVEATVRRAAATEDAS